MYIVIQLATFLVRDYQLLALINVFPHTNFGFYLTISK